MFNQIKSIFGINNEQAGSDELKRLQKIQSNSNSVFAKGDIISRAGSRAHTGELTLWKKDQVDSTARMQEISRATGFSVPKSVPASHDKHGLAAADTFKQWIGNGVSAQTGRTAW